MSRDNGSNVGARSSAASNAHITVQEERQTSDDRPSIFELVAADNLVSIFSPALKHIIKVIAENQPSLCGNLYNWRDEISLLLESLLQIYSLHNHDASFGEYFYGMKRCRSPDMLSLRTSDRLKSFIYLCILPYLKDKCDTAFQKWRERQVDGYQLNKLVRAFVSAYPYVHAMWDGTRLYHALLYTLTAGRPHHHSLWTRAAGVQLRYLTLHDLLLTSLTSSSGNNEVSSRWWRPLATPALSSMMSAGVFLLQFVNTWNQRQLFGGDVPGAGPGAGEPGESVPGPPATLTQSLPVAAASGHICPLCHNERRNDTALSVSGYVFCYQCIHAAIQERGRCPITGYPASLQHLIKLYPDSGTAHS